MRTLPSLILLVACTGETDSKTRTGQPGSTDTGDSGDTAAPVDGCRATPLAASAPRVVAVSHPYGDDGGQSNLWELLSLEDDTLTATGVTLELGRGGGAPVVWAPDGSLGVAVQDDGSIGVFTPDGTVIEAAWDADIYAVDAVFEPTGETLWVVDGNWVINGGGVYEVAVDCETGALTLVGLVVESQLGARLLGDVLVGDAAVAPIDLETDTLGESVSLFDYEDAIIGGADRRGDTLYVGDFSAFSGEVNRVAVVSLADGISRTGEIQLLDPYAIAAVEGGAIVASGYGDELIAIDASGELDTMASELPGAIALGPDDLALVAEVSGIRLVRLTDGALVEIDYYPTDGVAGLVGSIGVQP